MNIQWIDTTHRPLPRRLATSLTKMAVQTVYFYKKAATASILQLSVWRIHNAKANDARWKVKREAPSKASKKDLPANMGYETLCCSAQRKSSYSIHNYTNHATKKFMPSFLLWRESHEYGWRWRDHSTYVSHTAVRAHGQQFNSMIPRLSQTGTLARVQGVGVRDVVN